MPLIEYSSVEKKQSLSPAGSRMISTLTLGLVVLALMEYNADVSTKERCGSGLIIVVSMQQKYREKTRS